MLPIIQNQKSCKLLYDNKTISVANFRVWIKGATIRIRCSHGHFTKIENFQCKASVSGYQLYGYCIEHSRSYGRKYRRQVEHRHTWRKRARKYHIKDGLLYLRCSCCKQYLLHLDFSKRRNRGDNTSPYNISAYQSRCKQCHYQKSLK